MNCINSAHRVHRQKLPLDVSNVNCISVLDNTHIYIGTTSYAGIYNQTNFIKFYNSAVSKIDAVNANTIYMLVGNSIMKYDGINSPTTIVTPNSTVTAICGIDNNSVFVCTNNTNGCFMYKYTGTTELLCKSTSDFRDKYLVMRVFNLSTAYLGAINDLFTGFDISWNKIATISSATITAMYILSNPFTLYFGGNSGIYKFNGSNYTQIGSSPVNFIRGIYAYDTSNVYVSGVYFNGIKKYNGTTWSDVAGTQIGLNVNIVGGVDKSKIYYATPTSKLYICSDV